MHSENSQRTVSSSISPFDCAEFRDRGYSGPITIVAAQEMAEIRPSIEALLSREPAGDYYSRASHPHARWLRNRHLDSPDLLALATNALLLERLVKILGEDLLIWRVQIFNKEPGGREIPWHQDAIYWPLNPRVAVSAWIAIDEATTENSCAQLIPGSHRTSKPHVRSAREMDFPQMVDPSHVDTSSKIDMELRPGQCFLFTERLVHRSEPNRSAKRRMGVSVRFIPTSVKVLKYDGADHVTVLVHGEGRNLLNRTAK